MERLTILQGDCIEQMRTLPDESVHCIVTSPPYWGLRDYGVKGQIGLEATPEEYIETMVRVFREARILEGMRERRTVEWKANCECKAGTVPCVVLYPFGGSGTTGEVSIELGRRAVLIELNPKYVGMIERRCNVTAGLAL